MNAKYQGYSFPLRDTIQREKVRFHNRYGIELVGDLYLPMAISGKLAAVAVAGPFGGKGTVRRTLCRGAGQPWLCRSGL